MSDALRDELRDRFRLRTVLMWVGMLAGFRVVLDASVAQLAVTVVTGALFGLSEAVEEAYDLRSGVRWLGSGGVALVSGAALLAFDDGTAWLPAALLLIGAWILLDGVQTLRHEGLRDAGDVRDGEDVYREYLVRRVHETLADRPRTRRELADELDADDDDLDRALDALCERGLLERRGSELHVPSSDDEAGPVAAAREKLGSGADRLTRPVRLEFDE